MKFPQFQYSRPASLGEALQALSALGDDGVPIAGGQSLLAGLSMRIASPGVLVDIGDIAELKGISCDADSQSVTIGALTRHVEVLRSPLIREHLPLLSEAIHLVGHVAIRNRGTFGGSLAYADPAAELPACTVALGGVILVAGKEGQREIPAAEFFKGFLETALHPGELIVAVRFPKSRPNQVFAILEISRRAGDFAQAGITATANLVDGKLSDVRVVYFGCVDRAKIAGSVGAVLSGQALPFQIPDGLKEAVLADIEPSDSPGCRASTKAKWALVLTERVIGKLNERSLR